MADGIFVDLIPNFDEMERQVDKKKITKEVDVEGDGATGGMFGGGGRTLAMLGGILGGVAVIANAVSSLPQIQALMSMVNTVIQLTLLPFINMLFTFLKPILIDLIKLMPKWLSFWQDPTGNLMVIAEFIGEQIGRFASMLPSIITNAISQIPGLLGEAGRGLISQLRRRPAQTVGAGIAAGFDPLGILRGGVGGLVEGSTGREVNVTQNFRELSPEAQTDQMNIWQRFAKGLLEV